MEGLTSGIKALVWHHCILREVNKSFFDNRLEEAEDKYRSRQSRPEDLEVIEQLKRALAERELDMKKLVVSG